MCYNRKGELQLRVKKFKYMFFALICMCVTPLITNAECSYQRLAELSRLASNVQVTYTYDGSGFTIYMTNLTDDLYSIDNYGDIISGGAERTFNYYSGTISFDIFSNDSSCYGEKLLTKSITLPTINVESFRDECKQFPNFKYCQLWGDFSVSNEQFISELNSYKQELDDKKNSEIDEQFVVWNIILETIKNNIFMLIFFGVIIMLTIIYLYVKRKNK